MPPFFDPRTAFLLLGIMSLAASLGVFAALRVQVRSGNRQWAAAGLVFGAGCVLLALRGSLPEVISFEVTHACLTAGLLLHAASLRQESGPRIPTAWLLCGVLASALVYGLLRRIEPVYGLGYSALVFAVVSAAISVIALALWRRHRQAGALVIAIAFACFLAGLVVRTWFLPGSWARGGPLESGAHQVGLLVGGFLAVILSHVGYLGLQFDRLSAERVASERQAAILAERTAQTALREAALRELLRERNDMIQRLARSEAASELAHFATRLPHELSQPLCASRLNLENLRRHLEEAGTPGALLPLTRALEADNDRVMRMLDQLRILLRTQEEATREVLDLAALVAQTLPVVESSFEARGWRLSMASPHSPVRVEANQTQLQQLLLVLCTGVLDALRGADGPPGSCVVRIATAPLPDAEVLLSIELPALQASSLSVPVRSGLALAHRIAQAHHGRLEPRRDGGLSLWLPAAPARPHSPLSGSIRG